MMPDLDPQRGAAASAARPTAAQLTPWLEHSLSQERHRIVAMAHRRLSSEPWSSPYNRRASVDRQGAPPPPPPPPRSFR